MYRIILICHHIPSGLMLLLAITRCSSLLCFPHHCYSIGDPDTMSCTGFMFGKFILIRMLVNAYEML